MIDLYLFYYRAKFGRQAFTKECRVDDPDFPLPEDWTTHEETLLAHTPFAQREPASRAFSVFCRANALANIISDDLWTPTAR